MNYYDLDFISTSTIDLWIKAYVTGKPFPYLKKQWLAEGDKKAYFNIGALFDAMVLEPYRLNGNVLHQEDDTFTHFTWEDIDLVGKMAESVKREAGALFEGGKKQHTFIRNHKGFKIKGKLDQLFPSEISVDLKSTVSNSKESSLKSIGLFNYDQQGYVYGHLLAKVKKHIIVFCSKKPPHNVFIHEVIMDESDSIFREGKRKWESKMNKLQFYKNVKSSKQNITPILSRKGERRFF